MNFKISSPGKLLITSEYCVLKGAQAFAIPTKFKQHLNFKYKGSNNLTWKSFDYDNSLWFECEFEIEKFDIIKNQNDLSLTLQKILRSAKKLNPNFLSKNQGGEIITTLDFSKDWGLGTSSTIINNIAKWSNINSYELLWANYNGSGYDVACAQSSKPILYALNNGLPVIKEIDFNPTFSKNLFFVYLNTKKDSNKEVDNFISQKTDKSFINNISKLTSRFIKSKSLNEFQKCIIEHEELISQILRKEKVKNKYFLDYDGEIKSLGAWGGDFILAAGPENSKDYFFDKGFKTVFNYKTIF